MVTNSGDSFAQVCFVIFICFSNVPYIFLCNRVCVCICARYVRRSLAAVVFMVRPARKISSRP